MTAQRINEHIALFRVLLESCIIICHCATSPLIRIAVEWLKFCEYWKVSAYVAFKEKFGLESSYFDGCMYGLVSINPKHAG